jgi:hypothetical protein
MNNLIINETNVGDISAEIIASLMNLHILPHDVSQETFDKWMGVVEKTLRYEEQYIRNEAEEAQKSLPVCEICGGVGMEHFYHPSEE